MDHFGVVENKEEPSGIVPRGWIVAHDSFGLNRERRSSREFFGWANLSPPRRLFPAVKLAKNPFLNTLEPENT